METPEFNNIRKLIQHMDEGPDHRFFFSSQEQRAQRLARRFDTILGRCIELVGNSRRIYIPSDHGRVAVSYSRGEAIYPKVATLTDDEGSTLTLESTPKLADVVARTREIRVTELPPANSRPKFYQAWIMGGEHRIHEKRGTGGDISHHELWSPAMDHYNLVLDTAEEMLSAAPNR